MSDHLATLIKSVRLILLSTKSFLRLPHRLLELRFGQQRHRCLIVTILILNDPIGIIGMKKTKIIYLKNQKGN